MSIIKDFCRATDKIVDKQQNDRKEFDIDLDTINVEKDILYFNHHDCLLDIYEKKDLQGKKPVLLVIHGGSFVAGDKYNRRLLSRWSAERGYFVVNINYGLGPKNKFPEPIKHVAYALNWIEANAEKYNLDLDNIVVNGDSAGGYMACALTILSLRRDLQEKLSIKINVKIKAAILICGIYDFNYALNIPVKGKIMASLMKDIYGVNGEALKNVEFSESLNLIDLLPKDFPKCFICYSSKDMLCGGQSQLLMKKLDEYNIPYVEVHSTKFSDNHCYSLTWVSDAARECNNKISSFMEAIKIGG